VRKADNLPTSCDDIENSEGFNLLESSGPVQSCNATALLYVYFIIFVTTLRNKFTLKQ
jgi:hypothetical protein